MTCRLCNQDKALLKKSHIIPDFMYKDLYDDNHQLISFNAYTYKDDGKFSRLPSGEYNSKILCANCDNNIIGGYENYASRAIYGGRLHENKSPKVTNYKELSKIENLDYQTFKLFLLSILWRASISDRPFFENINIGAEYEEQIRTMILNNHPGDVFEFPFLVYSWKLDDSVPDDIILTPLQTDGEAPEKSVFIISGMAFVFYLSNQYMNDVLFEHTLKIDNTMSICHLKDGIIMKLIKRITNANNG